MIMRILETEDPSYTVSDGLPFQQSTGHGPVNSNSNDAGGGLNCWNLLIASLVPARISDGGARRFVYMCYLDVDTVYNRSHLLYRHSFATKSPDFLLPSLVPQPGFQYEQVGTARYGKP